MMSESDSQPSPDPMLVDAANDLLSQDGNDRGVVRDLASEDQQLLQDLSLAEGRQWMLASVAYHTDYARMLCSMYNATAVIHRYLPPELLMEVFGQIKPEGFGELRLLGVCRLWRDLLLRTAEFWVDMLRNIKFPERMASGGLTSDESESGWYQCFNMSLERSAPRDVFLTFKGFPEIAYTTLTPHTHRIVSLSVKLYPQNARQLFRLLHSGMPRLRTLAVSHLSGEQATTDELGGGTLPQSPHPSTGNAAYLPSLRVLSIPSVLLTSVSNGSLRDLTIGCASCKLCSGTRRPSLDDLLSFLRRCPHLTSLRFLRTSEPSINRRHTESARVSLTQLRELAFEETTSSWMSDVLRRLALPSETIVKFRSEAIQRIPQRINSLPAIHASDRLALEFRQEGTGAAYGGRIVLCEADASMGDTSFVNVRVTMDSKDTSVDTFGSVTSAFASASVRHLRVWIATPVFRIDRTRTIQLLASFPAISKLTWKRQVPNELFHALTSLTSAGIPICAGLEHLVVHWRLGSRMDEAAFRGTCTLIQSTLAHRASLGSRLRRFVFKCEGLKRVGARFDTEGEKDRLVQVFGALADEVVVVLKPDVTD